MLTAARISLSIRRTKPFVFPVLVWASTLWLCLCLRLCFCGSENLACPAIRRLFWYREVGCDRSLHRYGVQSCSSFLERRPLGSPRIQSQEGSREKPKRRLRLQESKQTSDEDKDIALTEHQILETDSKTNKQHLRCHVMVERVLKVFNFVFFVMCVNLLHP